jgi:hypothetical protein
MPVKLCQNFAIGSDHLGLTNMQRNNRLPLEYHLTSCIAHHGGRNGVERGLPGSYEHDYRADDPPSDDEEMEISNVTVISRGNEVFPPVVPPP